MAENHISRHRPLEFAVLDDPESVSEIAPALLKAAQRDVEAGEQGLRGAYAAALIRLEEQLEAVHRALYYRPCGRFDLTPCALRTEIPQDEWCPWCKLAWSLGCYGAHLDSNPASSGSEA